VGRLRPHLAGTNYYAAYGDELGDLRTFQRPLNNTDQHKYLTDLCIYDLASRPNVLRNPVTAQHYLDARNVLLILGAWLSDFVGHLCEFNRNKGYLLIHQNKKFEKYF